MLFKEELKKWFYLPLYTYVYIATSKVRVRNSKSLQFRDNYDADFAIAYRHMYMFLIGVILIISYLIDCSSSKFSLCNHLTSAIDHESTSADKSQNSGGVSVVKRRVSIDGTYMYIYGTNGSINIGWQCPNSLLYP